MRQAIETKYVGATNFRGSRVIVRAAAGRMIVPWDYALDINENHTRAAKAFATKMGWGGNWFGGGKANGEGNVYVWADGERMDWADFYIE